MLSRTCGWARPPNCWKHSNRCTPISAKRSIFARQSVGVTDDDGVHRLQDIEDLVGVERQAHELTIEQADHRHRIVDVPDFVVDDLTRVQRRERAAR